VPGSGESRRMDAQDVVLALVVVTALAFDFTNGFHDTASAMATSIATRALKPKVAVALAAVLNFVGAFISLEVATTIAQDIVDPKSITTTIIFAGLLGGIFWNLLTWRLGIPSSSSHALIGGVVGAVIVAAGFEAVTIDGLVGKVLVPSVVAPVLALAVAASVTFVVYRRIQRRDPERIMRSFRIGQVASASLVALAHGTNDAQKTMGVIVLALVANGNLSSGASVPAWVIVAAAPRSASAPMWAAGGSSAPSGIGSPRSRRRRASQPRPRAPSSSSPHRTPAIHSRRLMSPPAPCWAPGWASAPQTCAGASPARWRPPGC
jgi:inorganic phosphate transporter, PiT family